MAKLSAYANNLISANRGLKDLSYDFLMASQAASRHLTELFDSRPRLLRLWFRKVIDSNDRGVLDYGDYALSHKTDSCDIGKKQIMLWEHWGNVREEAQHRHSLTDPGVDASAEDILEWCSNLRHILSDVSRFEGMAARVSGRIKLKKMIKDMDDCGGISYLEGLWRAKPTTKPFDIVRWSQNCSEFDSVIDASSISKEKKELQLNIKNVRRLEQRIKDLQALKIQVELFSAKINMLLQHKGSVDNDHMLWFLEEVREWTYAIHIYCSDHKAKKPDFKKVKTSYARLCVHI